MTKRIVTLILVAVFVFSGVIFVSCAGEGGKTSTTVTATNTEETGEPTKTPTKTPTQTPVNPTPTPTETPVNPTETVPQPTETVPQPTETVPQPTETVPQPTQTPVNPTPTPTETPVNPTETVPQPTETPVTPTPTETPVTPTPTETPVTPTPTETPVTPTPTETPTTPTPTDVTTEVPEIPEEKTAAWAAWMSEYGSESEEYEDLEMLSSSFYNTSYKEPDGTEHDACPWEVWGDPKHLQFLITFDCTEFEINFNSSTDISPFTWYIFYKDADTDDDFQLCITKPWSLYDWGNGSFIFRTTTYLGLDGTGMQDLHTDDGAPNQYEFIIAIYDDETEELVCWHDCFPDVTDSYELYEEEALDNGYKLAYFD